MKMSTTVVAAVTFSLLLAACGVPDIGSNDDLFNVTVLNNTKQTVVDQSCSNSSCSSHNEDVALKPGKTLNDGEDPDGVVRSDRIVSTSGSVLGCLPFRFHSAPRITLVVNVSEMVPCGSTGGVSFTLGKNWPRRK